MDTTQPAIVTVDQAAELNELTLNWLVAAKPHMNASGRVRFLRAADFQSMPADRFDGMKEYLLSLPGNRA